MLILLLLLTHVVLCFQFTNIQGEPVEQNKRSPSDFLKDVLGRPVNVRLNSGTDYRGVLACLDGYMNIAMEQTEEYVDGQLKSKYGDCFIRGNNGTYSLSTYRGCTLFRYNICAPYSFITFVRIVLYISSQKR